ncbi:MAG: replicative DNA helicase [Bacilli bacterium]|nr:replicative DNA helicase [Bacilli bacterium]
MAAASKKKNVQVSDLPYNKQAEQACLGSAMLSKDALITVLSSLSEDDFFEGKHKLIYRALKNANERKVAVDVLTITEELINMKELDNIGGVAYLKTCTDSMVALSSLEFYVHIVNDQSTLRRLLVTLRGIDDKYHTEEIEDVDKFIQDSEAAIKDATEKRRVSQFKSSEEIAKKVEIEISTSRVTGEDEVTGLTTGYKGINKFTQGFQRGDMVIIAARPSVGKTALALNIGFRAATRGHVPVAIFSLEMASELLVKRLVASESGVSLKAISSGTVKGQDKAKVADAIKKISNAQIFIDDSPGLKLMDVVAKSRKLQAKLQADHSELGLVIIDYLGLVQTGQNGRNPDSRQEEVRKISLTLKDLARELKVPIIVISQLSRDVEKRDSKRPMLSDLRDSGNIEQDADVVMLLYREDYYKNSKNPAGDKKMKDVTNDEKRQLSREQREKQLAEQMPGDASYVEVNVAKNRNGQTGVAGLFFFKAFGRFDDPPEEFEIQKREIAQEILD